MRWAVLLHECLLGTMHTWYCRTTPGQTVPFFQRQRPTVELDGIHFSPIYEQKFAVAYTTLTIDTRVGKAESIRLPSSSYRPGRLAEAHSLCTTPHGLTNMLTRRSTYTDCHAPPSASCNFSARVLETRLLSWMPSLPSSGLTVTRPTPEGLTGCASMCASLMAFTKGC
jgi:hypothetical protein